MNAKQGKVSMNRTHKDSVFCDLFGRKHYLLQLYRVLHPEDADVTEDDLEIVTLRRVISAGEHNDLAFVAKDKLLLLVEAQSTWSVNIAVRLLFYLAETWRQAISAGDQDAYGAKRLDLPVPEFHVVYTGRKRRVPDTILLSRDVLGVESCALDVEVGVLRGGCDDIVGQYQRYTEIADNKVREMGRTAEAARAVVDECIAEGVLVDYLTGCRTEVEDMMITLFDDEFIQRTHDKTVREEGREEGRREERGTFVESLRSVGASEELIAAAIANADARRVSGA